jgi:alanine-synthesizing transaminase
MGNPDGATPPHIVEKLCTVAQRPDTHGYSTSRGSAPASRHFTLV